MRVRLTPEGVEIMTISGNYPSPVYVNGYQCNNCAEVAEAKKDINPAEPKAGPGGVDANTPANQAAQLASGQTPSSNRGPAVTFGGSLASNNPILAASGSASGVGASPSSQGLFSPNTAQGAQVSLTPGLGALLNISV
jgi:hypothetical protein